MQFLDKIVIIEDYLSTNRINFLNIFINHYIISAKIANYFEFGPFLSKNVSFSPFQGRKRSCTQKKKGSFERTDRLIIRATPFRAARFLFAQHERTLTGGSPQTALIVGRLQPKARVSTARWNLKEAGGKQLARWTRTWYKAEERGQYCKRSISPITIRTVPGKPSGYKLERVRP